MSSNQILKNNKKIKLCYASQQPDHTRGTSTFHPAGHRLLVGQQTPRETHRNPPLDSERGNEKVQLIVVSTAQGGRGKRARLTKWSGARTLPLQPLPCLAIEPFARARRADQETPLKHARYRLLRLCPCVSEGEMVERLAEGLHGEVEGLKASFFWERLISCSHVCAWTAVFSPQTCFDLEGSEM